LNELAVRLDPFLSLIDLAWTERTLDKLRAGLLFGSEDGGEKSELDSAHSP
jgi:hypothetical protein